jgi:hypothetical protein
MTPDNIADWPTASEAARKLNLSAETVRLYMNRRELRFIETRAGRVIDPEDLERLARERASRTSRVSVRS